MSAHACPSSETSKGARTLTNIVAQKYFRAARSPHACPHESAFGGSFRCCVRFLPHFLPHAQFRHTREQEIPANRQADAGTRTPDPFITSEVLYQLSYVGVCRDFPVSPHSCRGLVQRGCSKIEVGRCRMQA